jgi:hypothetical protein
MAGRAAHTTLAWLLAWAVLPALLGGLLFAAVESAQGLAPQPIRISRAGTYDPYMDDFVVFYAAGRIVNDGRASSVYDPAAVHRREAAVVAEPAWAIIPLPYYNPPHLLFGLAALSTLPIATAALLFTLVQLGAFAAALAILARARLLGLSGLGGSIAILALVASMPFHEVLLRGQISLVLFAAWAAIYLGAFHDKGDRWTVPGLAVLALKPQLAVVPLLYLLVQRRWATLARFAAVEAACTTLAVVAWGPGILVDFVALLKAASGWEDQNGIWVDAMFGWNALVRDLVGPQVHVARSVVSGGLSAATLALIAAVTHRRDTHRKSAETFAVLVFASLLVSPHLFAQDLVLAGLPLLLLATRGPDRERHAWALFGVLGWALTFVHFRFVHTDPLAHDINFVTLWLAGGVAVAAVGMRRVLDAWARLAGPLRRDLRWHSPATRRPMSGLVPLLLGLLFAGFLVATRGGDVARTFAAAVNYKYHVVAPNIANDGP